MILVNSENFKKSVLEKDFVVVDFYADWCGPCRMISPFLEEIENELKINIVKVDIDANQDLASEYEVMSIPTLAIFKNGEKISVNVGAASKVKIIDWIKSFQ